MPELPEVESARRLLEEHCKGLEVVEAIFKEGGGGPRDGLFDEKVVAEGVTEEGITAALLGRQLSAVQRKGKQLWMEFDGEGPAVLWHLGMTGSFVVEGKGRMMYRRLDAAAPGVKAPWPPRFAKAELRFRAPGTAPGASETIKVAFCDPRRFGRILLRADPPSEAPVSRLALDPLTEAPGGAALFAAFQRTSAPVKAVLLDQNRVVCGVGNWVADEVLFQARVHPASRCDSLSEAQCAAVAEKLEAVLRHASEVRADYQYFPRDWLFHYRWNKGKEGKEKGDGVARMPNGMRIVFDTVGGRTTAIVPEAQAKGQLGAPRKKAARAGKAAKAPQKKRKRAPKEEDGAEAKADPKKESLVSPPKKAPKRAPARRPRGASRVKKEEEEAGPDKAEAEAGAPRRSARTRRGR